MCTTDLMRDKYDKSANKQYVTFNVNACQNFFTVNTQSSYLPTFQDKNLRGVPFEISNWELLASQFKWNTPHVHLYPTFNQVTDRLTQTGKKNM